MDWSCEVRTEHSLPSSWWPQCTMFLQEPRDPRACGVEQVLMRAVVALGIPSDCQVWGTPPERASLLASTVTSQRGHTLRGSPISTSAWTALLYRRQMECSWIQGADFSPGGEHILLASIYLNKRAWLMVPVPGPSGNIFNVATGSEEPMASLCVLSQV